MNEFRDMLTNDIKEANVVIAGIPLDKNASVGKGASLAPKTLRELSYDLPALDMKGNLLNKTRIFDVGDFTSEDFDVLTSDVYNKVINGNDDKFQIILGGDHSIAIASERAFFKKAKEMNKEPVIIHIDAHPDICDTYHDSKFSHACPIKRALDYGYEDKNVTLIGVRGFEAQEIETFKKHKELDWYKAIDVNVLGVERLLNILINKYKDDKYMIYISYDIDANDPSYAPGTGTPEAFGLKSIDTMNLICGLIKSLNVKMMDFVEIAPPLDVNNITSWLALKTMYEIFNVLQNK